MKIHAFMVRIDVTLNVTPHRQSLVKR